MHRRNKGDEEDIGDVEGTDRSVDDLIKRMQNAAEADRNSNAKG